MPNNQRLKLWDVKITKTFHYQPIAATREEAIEAAVTWLTQNNPIEDSNTATAKAGREATAAEIADLYNSHDVDVDEDERADDADVLADIEPASEADDDLLFD